MTTQERRPAGNRAAQVVDETEISVTPRRRRFEYRVTYRRADWKPGSTQTRLFQSRPAADRYVDRLLSGGRPELAPLTVLRIDRRPVGDWSAVWSGR